MENKLITFEEFLKLLTRNSIRFTVSSDWSLLLPNSTRQSTVQKLIGLCREHLLVTWHIVYPEPTEEFTEPDIQVWWEQK